MASLQGLYSMETEDKNYRVQAVEGNPETAASQETQGGMIPLPTGYDANRPLSPTTKKNFKSIVVRFLTWRGVKGRDGSVAQAQPVRSRTLGPARTVSVPKAVRRRTEVAENRKSGVELEKPMDGVGLATGNGGGDMEGVRIKDFAYLLGDMEEGLSEETPFAVWPRI